MVLKEIGYTMAASLAMAVSLAIAPALPADKGDPSPSFGGTDPGPVLADRTVEDLYPGCVRAPADKTQQGLPQPELTGVRERKSQPYKMDCPPGYTPGAPLARSAGGRGG